MPIRKVLVPIDFSPASSAALRYGKDFAERFGATVHVLHAWEVPVYLRPDLTIWSGELRTTVEDHVQSDAENQMKTFFADAGMTPGPGVTAQVALGIPEAAILGIAEEGAFDLIVMGTHGRTGLAHVLLGSVAENVVRTGHRPIVTIRGKE